MNEIEDMDQYDYIYLGWAAAFDDATEAVMLILPGNDRDLVRAAIEEAHTQDDPDWTFNVEALIERLVEDPSEDVYETLEALFPVSP